MADVKELLARNRAWAARRVREDPQFFERLCEIQRPGFLWIGCSDSRVPANVIVGLEPGEMFVHRNVANVVDPGDTNCMAVVQYAVEVLEVPHIIVCGHYGCGGIRAVLDGNFPRRLAAHVERWLAPIYHLAGARTAELSAVTDFDARWRVLCEWNVREQVRRLLASDVLQGSTVSVHGWIYDLHDGILRDLGV